MTNKRPPAGRPSALLLMLFFSTNSMACDEGVWDMSSLGVGPDQQTFVNPASSVRYCLFDGALEMDEFRALSKDGQVIFRGVSFNYDQGDSRKTLWVMVGDPGHTLITAHFDDGVLVSDASGIDGYGEFLETSQTTFDEDRGYVFVMNRSYDGGENWIEPFNRIDATLVASDAPPLPQELASPVSDTAEALGRSGIAILDGYAQIEEIEEQRGDDTVRIIRFSSLYGPGIWRDLSWELGAEEIRTETETPGKDSDGGS